jgi:diguanylate cyclase (GGDEF)-like protein
MSASEKMARMGYWSWRSESEHLEVSVSLSRLLKLEEVRLKPNHFFNLIREADRSRVQHAISRQRADEAGEEVKLEFQLEADGSQQQRYFRQISRRLKNEDGSSSLFGSVQEITDIKRAQQRIYRMAYCDSLTGLANRVGFYEQLDKALEDARHTGNKVSVLYLDMDDFKGVNDYYGHKYGDEYLVKLADHLRWAVGPVDSIARLGGDEFCVIVAENDTSEIELLTQKIFQFCQCPIDILGQPIQPKLSIGVAAYPDHAATSEELVSNADLAMYDAKRSKLGMAFFNHSMAAARTAQLKLEDDLRQALEDQAFELWYQPKISAVDGTIAGVEALIRWRGTDGKFVSPELFIPAAEHAGLIKEIGSWVLRNACEQLRAWNVAGCNLRMAVNISGDHFSSTEFVDEVQQVIQSCEIRANQLEIEITESLSRDPKSHSRICHLLRNLGVRIAIDDFGTGYSSLSVLGQLEVDTLKIDQSFITNLPDQDVSRLMVNKIMELALGLGYEVVAEGVETKEQIRFLTEIGCPCLQGFFFSEPQPANRITTMLFAEENRWCQDLCASRQSHQPSV